MVFQDDGGRKDADEMMESDEQQAADQDEIIAVVPLDDVLDGRVNIRDLVAGAGPSQDSDDGGEMSDQEIDEEDIEPPSDDAVLKLEGLHLKDVFSLDAFGCKWLASGSEDDTALLLDMQGDMNTPVLKITEHNDSVAYVRFNAKGTLLATGDMSGKIIITALGDLSRRCVIDDCADLEWLTWHTSKDILFAGGADGMVWMWLISGDGVAQSKVFASGAGVACTVGVVLPDEKRLLTGYADGSVRIWNLRDGTDICTQVPSPCTSADVHNSLALGVVGCQSGIAVMLNTDNGKIIRVLQPQKTGGDEKKDEEADEDMEVNNSVETVRLCQDHPWVAVGTNSGLLSIFDINTGIERHKCDHEGFTVVKCLFRKTADGGVHILSSCLDGAIRIWDARDGEPVKVLSGAGAEIFDVITVEHEASVKVVTACEGGVIRVFDA
uniref:WD_REPEATS_REGION domain-containing protein n=1 Tax=Steinernema glaseri TaxID=37863 RepID=A0A1I7ZUW1_9BILA